MQITDLLVPERVALNMQVADKAMAIHVLDVFCAMERSSEKGRRAVVNSTCRRPEAFREGTNLFSL